MSTALLRRGRRNWNSSTVENSDVVVLGKKNHCDSRPDHKYGHQRLWRLAHQRTHSLSYNLFPNNFYTYKPMEQTKWKGVTKKENTLLPHWKISILVFFLLEPFKSLFQQQSSSVSASTTSNISELRLIRSEGCFLR